MIKEYYGGFDFIRAGMKMVLADKKLMRLALIPFFINVILFIWALIWGGGKVGPWADRAVGYLVSPDAGFWFSLLYYPLLLVFWLAFVVVTIYMVYFIGSVIAAPFNSMLAEASLIKNGVITERPFHIRSWLALTLRMVMISLMKAIVLGSVGLLIFVASFIPIVNILAAFFAFLIIAFDIMDYSLEMMEMSLAQRFKYFKKNFSHFSGMATMIGLTMFIPGLTFLVLPCAVVGATNVAQKIKDKSQSSLAG